MLRNLLMRIVILAHNLRVGGGLSVGRNIVALLPKVAPQHQYIMVVPSGLCYDTYIKYNNIVMKEVPFMSLPKRAWFDSIKLPQLIKHLKPDRIWGLGNIGLIDPPCPQALLFHKAHLIYPSKYYANELFSKRIYNAVLKKQFRNCLPKTKLVFCQTDVIRERFLRVMNYKGHVSLCPNALSYLAKASVNVSAPEIFAKFSDKLVLFTLAKYYAHKNLELIVETFSRCRDRLSDVICIITIDKSQHPNADSLLKKIKKEGLEDQIINVGPLEQSQLANYFINSYSLLLPTLLESFSGTYLEAMYYGLPILTSDLDFARGICGDAAIYFNPWNCDSICKAIEKIRDDKQLMEILKIKGQKRIKTFFRSWPEIISRAIVEIENL